MPSNREINEPTEASPRATSARWVATGGCAGTTGTGWAGTTGIWVQTCDAATATNIAIATRIAVDTAIETIEAGIARTKTETIEATMKIGLDGA